MATYSEIRGDFRPDNAITFVTIQATGDIHVFIADSYGLMFVKGVADRFRLNGNTTNLSSQKCQQPVKVFHDDAVHKYRLCPLSLELLENPTLYDGFLFERDESDRAVAQRKLDQAKKATELQTHIPRPKNKQSLYQQAMSPEIARRHPGITSQAVSAIISEMWKNESLKVLAFWQSMADEEERQHKLLYPNYKYAPPKFISEKKLG
ncbi:hypothetical protein B0T10DRAFT_465439 [Thelonectria olida]|uniref:HMG box domain-containing protein n=1 Tax=Thelonectria olida TaxID=1576542 RepID=A0A9P8VSM6_9HYPO|nr:hypothetical protein B0T10DRAFT_465439 [Thelonectria olida]